MMVNYHAHTGRGFWPFHHVLETGAAPLDKVDEMRKYALPEGPCKCASIDPQIRMGNRSCIKKFLPIQAWALYEMATAGGLVGSIPVGAGKTLLSVMGALALGVGRKGSGWMTSRSMCRSIPTTSCPKVVMLKPEESGKGKYR